MLNSSGIPYKKQSHFEANQVLGLDEGKKGNWSKFISQIY